MKINRWIYFPVFTILFYVLQFSVSKNSLTADNLFYAIVMGAVTGFILLYWSDSKARKISVRNDEEIYKVKQKRTVTLLLNYEKAFKLCKESLFSLNRSKIKKEDSENGIITAKTPMNLTSWGQRITLNLKKLNENLTEVEISTCPIPRTALIDYGEGWKYTEDISRFLTAKDAEINQKVLADSLEILDDVYVKPFQKEKVER